MFILTAVSRFFSFKHRPENQPEKNFKRLLETPLFTNNELFFDQTEELRSIL